MITLESEEFVGLVASVAEELSPFIDSTAFLGMAVPGGRLEMPRATKALLDLIASTEALASFQSGWVQSGGAGHIVQPHMLVAWLVRRSMRSAPGQAVSDLHRYLQATELPVKRRTLVAGITAGNILDFGEGAKFVPRALLKDDSDHSLEREWKALFTPRSSFVQPSGVIETELVIPKRHWQSGAQPAHATVPTEEITNHLDQILAMQVTMSGASPLSTWTSLPEWCPLQTSGMSIYQVPQILIERQLTDVEIADFPNLVRRVGVMNVEARNALALAAPRLTAAATQVSPVEQAVDLRIAYEVTFSIGDEDDPDKKGELRFRLAQRAAHFLGQSPEERRAIFKSARELYDLCSGAIHSGQISGKWAGERGVSVIKGGTEIVRRALQKVILSGVPDWNSLLFG